MDANQNWLQTSFGVYSISSHCHGGHSHGTNAARTHQHELLSGATPTWHWSHPSRQQLASVLEHFWRHFVFPSWWPWWHRFLPFLFKVLGLLLWPSFPEVSWHLRPFHTSSKSWVIPCTFAVLPTAAWSERRPLKGQGFASWNVWLG